MADRCVLIFIEGDTEVEFYKKLLQYLRCHCKNQQFACNIEIKNLKGIGNYKHKALNTFRKAVQPKHRNKSIDVILCYDEDVFKLAPKPPVDWIAVKKALIQAGARNVFFVSAKLSIEDWFLNDAEGVLRFLNLSSGTKIVGSNGTDKLERLYKLSNKVYVKGSRNDDLIEALDISKIICSVCKDVRIMCKVLGVICPEQNKKK